MKCVACQKDFIKKDLLYTEDRELVCVNPFTCSDEHPNSVTNILARKGSVKLYTDEELEESMLDRLQVSDEMKTRITTVVTKPQSIRLSKLPIAHYIVAKMEETPELNSISEAVRHCIEIAMKVEPLRDVTVTASMEAERKAKRQATREAYLDKAKALESQSLVEQTKGTSGALTGIVVPDVPKSVNVDWSKVESTPVPVSTPVDDEEDVF